MKPALNLVYITHAPISHTVVVSFQFTGLRDKDICLNPAYNLHQYEGLVFSARRR